LLAEGSDLLAANSVNLAASDNVALAEQ